MWTAPPPAWTQTDPNDIRTAEMPVVKGSTQVPLRWNYTLPAGVLLISSTFSKRLNDGSFDDIGTAISGGNTVVFDRNDYRTRFNISRSEVATLIINKVTEREEAVYHCRLTTVSNSWRNRIRVIVTVPARLTNVSHDQTVLEGSNMTLLCEATGRPTPNITWTRVLQDGSNGELLRQGQTWDSPNISRTASGAYRCTAYNRFGNRVSHQMKVNVTYPAKIIKLRSEHEVAAQQSVSLVCQAEGNPQPAYSWTPCDPQQSACHESTLNISEVLSDIVYTCSVTNSLGDDARNTSVVIASDVINVTLVITSEECTDKGYNQLWEKLGKTIDEIFAGYLGYESVQLRSMRCGSVIVDLALKFSSTVRESDVLSILKDAVKNGGFGEFNVIAITGTRSSGITTTPTSSPDIQACGDCACSCTLLGVLIGVLVVIIIALVVYILWLHKKGTATRDRVNRAASNEERRKIKTQLEMDDIRPDEDPARIQNSGAPLQSQYTSLNQASRLQNASQNGGNKVSSNASQSSQYAPLHPSTRSWEVPRQHVTLEKIIGKGAFGQVAKGTAKSLRGRTGKTLMAIKMLRENAPETDKRDLLSELEIMKQLKPHPHVIKLLGCVTESDYPPRPGSS